MALSRVSVTSIMVSISLFTPSLLFLILPSLFLNNLQVLIIPNFRLFSLRDFDKFISTKPKFWLFSSQTDKAEMQSIDWCFLKFSVVVPVFEVKSVSLSCVLTSCTWFCHKCNWTVVELDRRTCSQSASPSCRRTPLWSPWQRGPETSANESISSHAGRRRRSPPSCSGCPASPCPTVSSPPCCSPRLGRTKWAQLRAGSN